MLTEKEKSELSLLIIELLDGTISDESLAKLDNWLRESTEAFNYYCNYTRNLMVLKQQLQLSVISNDSSVNDTVLKSLAKNEQNAPEVIIEKSDDSGLVEKKDDQKNISVKPNKLYSMFSRIISLAAVLMIIFVVYANIFPPRLYEKVATVTDLMGARWDKSSTTLTTGEKITTDSIPFKLEKGIIQFSYDEGVDLVIEGPAEFTVEKKGIDLTYGRLYSYVPETGHGFTVDTPNNRFVDLGTEFGVHVSKFGNSELHVMTGKVQLFAGGSKEGKKTRLVTEKEAVLYDSSTGTLNSIEFRPEGFVRAINSTSQFVWRGRDLNLADIIAGGDGLGKGTKQSAIDLANGEMIPWGLSTDQQSDGRYISVDASRFIDGVFVPDGGDGPITISSENHTWNAPATTGEYKFNIVSSLRILDDISDIRVGSSGSDIMLEQSLQGTKSVHMALPQAWSKSDTSEHSSIFMHSNLGITYDLDELRKVVQGQRLSSFKSTFGIAEQYMRLEGVDLTEMHIDLWVLIDGEVKYSAKEVDATKLLDIDIEINESDSFLSLVVTQSSDGFKYDWGLFVDPVVKLESIK